ncbi:hypothetical protein [Anderseniella sp. Alg231-50]|uniref:hypothetical protein n=1 Tax=Anderseniella sp. Alg231-50 TaxID=1922226 RepID=UPI00307BE795
MVALGSESDIEIYRQRYETFRHLDRLRWQMLQLLIALGTAVTFVLRTTSAPSQWWFFGLVGAILGTIGFVMFRINSGARQNGRVLSQIGKRIGDDSIPNVSGKWRTTSHWTAVLIVCVAIGCLIAAFGDFLGLFELSAETGGQPNA